MSSRWMLALALALPATVLRCNAFSMSSSQRNPQSATGSSSSSLSSYLQDLEQNDQHRHYDGRHASQLPTEPDDAFWYANTAANEDARIVTHGVGTATRNQLPTRETHPDYVNPDAAWVDTETVNSIHRTLHTVNSEAQHQNAAASPACDFSKVFQVASEHPYPEDLDMETFAMLVNHLGDVYL